MMVGWYCPFVDDPKLCVGAVIESQDAPTGQSAFIPVILPPTDLAEAMELGPRWLVANFAQPLIAFLTDKAASDFLHDTFQAHMWHALSPEFVDKLIVHYGGFVCDAREFHLFEAPDDPSLN